jgi:hypothetical protein
MTNATDDLARKREVATLIATARMARQELDTDDGRLSITERNRLLLVIQDAFAGLVDLEEAGEPDATSAVDYVGGWL